jgi:hypothetical protein
MRRKVLSSAAVALIVWGLGSREARADGRQGQGRIDLAIGPRAIPNGPFLSAQHISGNLSSTWSVGPTVLGTFGYWVDEHFELSLEGSYGYDSYAVPPTSEWRIGTTTLGGALRFAPFSLPSIAWPYLGLNFGYSLNHVLGPLNPSEEADGYGGAILIGSGFDFSPNWGGTIELRYTYSQVVVPNLHPTLNTGGLSLLFGIYLRIQAEPDEFGHHE